MYSLFSKGHWGAQEKPGHPTAATTHRIDMLLPTCAEAVYLATEVQLFTGDFADLARLHALRSSSLVTCAGPC